MRSTHDLQDWEVCIETFEGERLPEHQIVHTSGGEEDGPTVECFLECEEGQEFQISVRPPKARREQDVAACLFIDGRCLSGFVVEALNCEGGTRRAMFELRNGVMMRMNLCFGRMAVTDQEALAQTDHKILNNLGIIKAVLRRGTAGPARHDQPPQQTPSSVGVLHETMKKGLLGTTVMGGTAEVAAPTMSRTPFTPENFKRPDCTFVFKYRTREMLQAIRVIEPSALEKSPPTTSGDDKKEVRVSTASTRREDDPDEARIRALETELAELRIKKVKKERDIGPSVKRERNIGPSRTERRKAGNEVVDLTGVED